MAYKREDWNGLIDDVNDVITQPPQDTNCVALAALPHVGPNHKWSKTDILAVQSALRQTCGSIDFQTLPERWKRSIIDEIEAAMGHVWCDCESTVQCADVAVAVSPVESPDPWGDQSFYYLRKYFIAGEETCAGSTTVAQRCNIAIHDAINGMQLFPNEDNVNVRWWKAVQLLDVFAPEQWCTVLPEEEKFLAHGLVWPSGNLGSYPGQSPRTGGYVLFKIYIGDTDYAQRGRSYELRGLCFNVDLTNKTLPVGSPAGTPIGDIVVTGSDEALEGWSVDLYPGEPYTNNSGTISYNYPASPWPGTQTLKLEATNSRWYPTLNKTITIEIQRVLPP
jgi:hypothetical protein